MDNSNFMDIAIDEANEGLTKGEGGPFGAVIIRNNQIIDRAHNMVLKTNDPTSHAEITCIRKASAKLGTFDLSDCEIYSTCEPCPMCLGAIYWARPERIVYACTKQDAAAIDFDDQFIYDEIAVPIPERKIPTVQVGRDEALSVFELWASKVDKKEY